MSEPVWLTRDTVLILHERSLLRYGGLAGLRDAGLLDSAIARPRNLHGYEDVSDLARLAGSYAAGIVRNHPFADGNKRAAFAAAGAFLKANGMNLRVGLDVATAAVFDLAAGSLSEEAFADLLRAHLHPRT